MEVVFLTDIPEPGSLSFRRVEIGRLGVGDLPRQREMIDDLASVEQHPELLNVHLCEIKELRLLDQKR